MDGADHDEQNNMRELVDNYPLDHASPLVLADSTRHSYMCDLKSKPRPHGVPLDPATLTRACRNS